MKRILLIKFRHIGDVLLSTPLIENLKLHFPTAKIDVAINEECEPILSHNPHINQIFGYNRKDIKKSNFTNRILKELSFTKKIARQPYDLTINLTEGDRGTILSYLTRSPLRFGYGPNIDKFFRFSLLTREIYPDPWQHTVLKDLSFLKFLNLDVLKHRVKIYWLNHEKKSFLSKTNHVTKIDYIHFHPLSRWQFKCWNDYKVANLIDYIQKKYDLRVILTAGPNRIEIERIQRIINLCKTPPIDLSGKLTLKELAFLSAHAKMFIGVDSAPMHIAAAVDTPVVALFGASYPSIWGPWDNDLNITHFKNIDGIQHSGKHSIISNMNHQIFFDNKEMKRSFGMEYISLDDVKKVIDERL